MLQTRWHNIFSIFANHVAARWGLTSQKDAPCTANLQAAYITFKALSLSLNSSSKRCFVAWNCALRASCALLSKGWSGLRPPAAPSTPPLSGPSCSGSAIAVGLLPGPELVKHEVREASIKALLLSVWRKQDFQRSLNTYSYACSMTKLASTLMQVTLPLITALPVCTDTCGVQKFQFATFLIA